MFNEAMSAIQSGDRARARDLLTRLLKATQDNPDYWVWMSAVVETTKERLYCLNQAIKLDPQHKSARRGLTLMGQMTPDESLILPARLQRRNWQGILMPADEEPVAKISPVQIGLMVAGLVVVVGLLAVFIFGDVFRQRQQTVVQSSARHYPTETPTLTATVATSANGTPLAVATGQPKPLWMLLEATYTPTPLYINTPHPAVEAFKYGLRGYLRGDWASMDNFMKQALTAEPDAVDVRYYMADALRLQKKYTQALKAFNDLIKAYPNFAPSYLGRARTRLASDPGATDAAISDLQLALDKDPNLGEAYLELCSLLIEDRDYTQAGAYLDQAAQVMPNSALVFTYRARVQLHAGDYEAALADVESALNLDKTLLDAYLMKGEALVMMGDIPGSQEALTVYTTYVDDDPQAWLWVGLAQEASGDSASAIQSYSRALRLKNTLEDALIHRARLYLADEDGERALEDYRAVLRLDSESFEASMGVGKALMLMKYDGDAYMQFERAQGLAKEDEQKAELYYWRAQSLEKLGELEVAVREWGKLLDLPRENLSEDMVSYARQRLLALSTATPTTRPSTATRTPVPTGTRVPTDTRMPTRTPLPSSTPRPTATR